MRANKNVFLLVKPALKALFAAPGEVRDASRAIMKLKSRVGFSSGIPDYYFAAAFVRLHFLVEQIFEYGIDPSDIHLFQFPLNAGLDEILQSSEYGEFLVRIGDAYQEYFSRAGLAYADGTLTLREAMDLAVPKSDVLDASSSLTFHEVIESITDSLAARGKRRADNTLAGNLPAEPPTVDEPPVINKDVKSGKGKASNTGAGVGGALFE